MNISSCTLMCALHLLLLLYFTRSVLTQLLFNDGELYEGSRCEFKDRTGEGVCVRVANCPDLMAQIHEGDYTRIQRCSFSNFDEIICCANIESETRIQVRAADAACERYQGMVFEPRLEFTLTNMVIGGVAAKEREFPAMAALGYSASDEEEDAIGGIKYLCGGTLISEKHVITAAHCVNDAEGLVPVEVLLGAINLSDQDSTGTQRVPISRIIKHPQYRRSLKYHDVAILELENFVQFSADVHPTCLMTKPSPSLTANGGPSLHILGWGAIDLDGTTSMTLLKAEGLKFVDTTECSKSYRNNLGNIPNGLDDGMICVVDANTTRRADTCWGDSGGPLFISSAEYPLLAGVTSFGQGCGGTTPGVYASVYKYLSWIEDQVWPSSN